MLTELCAELHNYFCQDADKHFGEFTISGGSIETPLDYLQEGQYFRIVGSTFNDGVYQYPASNLTDEAFNGAIWAMRLPPSFIALSARIDELNDSIDKFVADTPKYASESYPDGYSYSVLNDMPAELKTEYARINREKRRWQKI